ncbi:predicted protein [Uncinocarpus reesii 1704]|uniref:Aminoglycoside phosphotransferase domain-containing protein n=1 Tax=Uncinocarpus reesii (strain UAMH 1704) TaxID=336963 RepID=C4JLZ2_UNCRE|nr:uncharacterized protein UREG_03850 [Uncinocarpus reesii 1704]EEP79004.1 predicted protein [Uncinocarpus reesii 1704]
MPSTIPPGLAHLEYTMESMHQQQICLSSHVSAPATSGSSDIKVPPNELLVAGMNGTGTQLQCGYLTGTAGPQYNSAFALQSWRPIATHFGSACLSQVVMGRSPIKQEEIDSARWIVGKRGASHGVYITESGTVVKYGHHVQAEREARAMSFVRRACPQVPVPEVLGWWEEGEGKDRVGHLAMSLIPGDMLIKSWPTMDQVQRDSILKDLEEILHQLRTLRAPSTAVIGPVDGTSPAADVRDGHAEFGGPFKTESDFNE